MPIKNTSLYLEKCIDSILRQTHSNWELLAVDDHSDDDSYNIIEKFSKADGRIKPIKNNGKGIIDALQVGYEHATGEFITRMDSDDYMSDEKLDLMIHVLANKPNSLALGLVEYFSEQALGNGYRKYAAWLNKLTLDRTNFTEIYRECTIPSPCWMTDRQTFDSCGGFSENVYPEDYDLAFRFRNQGLSLIPIPKVLHYWRDHQERTSRNSPIYEDNRFTPLKVNHFVSQDLDKNSRLILWGAGKRGKDIAQNLIARDVSFIWLTNNKNKIGKEIYGVMLEDIDQYNHHGPNQYIISLSSPKDKTSITNYIKQNPQHQYFFFT